VNFLDRSFSDIVNVNYTKNMEEDLDKIAEGQEKKLDFLNKFYNELETTISSSQEVAGATKTEEKVCPLCGSPMVVRRSKYGKLFYGCSTYPKCRGIVNMK